MVRHSAALLILASTAFAGEGVVMVQKHENLRDNSTSTIRLYVESDKVAVNTDAGARRTTFAYLADEGLLRIIDHEKKTVREMTEQEMEQMMAGVQEQMTKMRAQMEEQMKGMSPQQRAMMEKMLGSKMAQLPGPPTGEKTEYRRAGGSAEISGHACDWYEGYRGGQMAAKVCAADFSALDLRPSDFAVFRRLAEFLTKLAPQMADQMRFGTEDWRERGGFPGVPMQQQMFDDGKEIAQTTLESADRESIDSVVYDAPAGYERSRGLAPR
ncbi:MAG: hypothetical protein GC160_04155 [Acidobacteria bacterium]|nr:hypothetical protein [Acidobacteriota bacterium]